MDKVVATAAEAVADVQDGASLAVGGFGLSGVPERADPGAVRRGASAGLAWSPTTAAPWTRASRCCWPRGRIARVTGSYIGGEQGVRPPVPGRGTGGRADSAGHAGRAAARRRCGIPAFYTPAGVGTQVAEGGLPWRYDGDGGVALASPPKEVREFDGAEYVLERGITTDFALVRAAKGDRHGNLVFNKSARNFNPLAAMAGRITVAEVEELVEPGELDPDEVHLPGVFVQRVVALTPEQAADKKIERRTVTAEGGAGLMAWTRDEMAARAAAGTAATASTSTSASACRR